MLPVRKRIRLPRPEYLVPGRAFSITIGTSPRGPVFADLAFGRECIDSLRQLRASTGIRVYAYCLMPDHVHLLLGADGTTEISSFVGRWKSICAWRRARQGSRDFWQRGFL